MELGEPDVYVVAIAASREARLQELADELAKAKRPELRARLVAQERAAAGDMTKALEAPRAHVRGLCCGGGGARGAGDGN